MAGVENRRGSQRKGEAFAFIAFNDYAKVVGTGLREM